VDMPRGTLLNAVPSSRAWTPHLVVYNPALGNVRITITGWGPRVRRTIVNPSLPARRGTARALATGYRGHGVASRARGKLLAEVLAGTGKLPA